MAPPPSDRDLFDRLQFFKDHRPSRGLVLGTCLVGIAYGFYYYLEQFRATPPPLWIFVPDSPLAVLWAFLGIVLHAAGRRNDYVDALGVAANAQVGLWTAYVLLAYPAAFRIHELNLNFVLFWGHLGMVALAALLVRDLRASLAPRPGRRLRVLSLAAGWLLLGDVVDYLLFRGLYGTGCGLRPFTVPCDATLEPLLAVVTFALTFGSVGFLAWVTRARAVAETPPVRVPVEARPPTR